MPTISKRARYAIHGLAYVTTFSDDKPVPFDEILAYLRAYSSSLILSSGYLAKLFQDVARTGLVESVPGPKGGYRLARPAASIPLLEIVEALDGPTLTQCCLLAVRACSRQDDCGVHRVIHEAETAFRDVLAGQTLESMASSMAFPDRASIQAQRRQPDGGKGQA